MDLLANEFEIKKYTCTVEHGYNEVPGTRMFIPLYPNFACCTNYMLGYISI